VIDSLEQQREFARRDRHILRARGHRQGNTVGAATEAFGQQAIAPTVVPENLRVRPRPIMKDERGRRARLVSEHLAHNAGEAVERQSQVDASAGDVYRGRNPNHGFPPTSAATMAARSQSLA
jgi:hypothetical protein